MEGGAGRAEVYLQRRGAGEVRSMCQEAEEVVVVVVVVVEEVDSSRGFVRRIRH